MIRISASNLDTYRYYKLNEDVSLDECIADLRRERPPSPTMLAGRALHKILETAGYGDEAISVERDGYTFSFQGDIAVDVPAVRELKGEMVMNTHSGPVSLVGVVDGVDSSVIDYKLTGRWDAERLADSYQWRFYLHMFNRTRFVYKVFVGDEKKPNEWTIREYHELALFAYPRMEEDLRKEIEEFAAFMKKYVLRKAA